MRAEPLYLISFLYSQKDQLVSATSRDAGPYKQIWGGVQEDILLNQLLTKKEITETIIQLNQLSKRLNSMVKRNTKK